MRKLLILVALASCAPAVSNAPAPPAPAATTTANASPAPARTIESGPPPPVARKEPKVDTVHGHSRTDDYFWLRSKDTPDVLAYLAAENAYADAVSKPTEGFQDALYKERPELVILIRILSDPINAYAAEFQPAIVDTINGRKINTLDDAAKAFAEPARTYAI